MVMTRLVVSRLEARVELSRCAAAGIGAITDVVCSLAMLAVKA